MGGEHPPLSLEWRGGAFTAAESVPLSDRGFRYGLALFETLRISRGRALFVAEHLALLRASALASGWWREAEFPGNALEAAARILAGEGEFTLPPEGLARVHLTAGDGSFTDCAGEARVYLTAQFRPAPDEAAYEEGINVGFYPPDFAYAAPGLKSHNYWGNLTALRRAAELGWQETLLVDVEGEISGFCLGNLFLELDGEWLTPRLESGCRPGITRQWVLNIARGMVRETRITVVEALAAEGAFLTSSGWGVLPVASLERLAMPVSKSTHELMKAFRALL